MWASDKPIPSKCVISTCLGLFSPGFGCRNSCIGICVGKPESCREECFERNGCSPPPKGKRMRSVFKIISTRKWQNFNYTCKFRNKIKHIKKGQLKFWYTLPDLQNFAKTTCVNTAWTSIKFSTLKPFFLKDLENWQSTVKIIHVDNVIDQNA